MRTAVLTIVLLTAVAGPGAAVLQLWTGAALAQTPSPAPGLSAAPTPTAAPSKDAIKCQSKKNKAAGKYASCLLKTESKAVKKGATANTSKCVSEFQQKWGKIETEAGGACPSEGDQTAMQAFVAECASCISDYLSGAVVWCDCLLGIQPTTTTTTTTTIVSFPDLSGSWWLTQSSVDSDCPDGITLPDFANELYIEQNGTALTAVAVGRSLEGSVSWTDFELLQWDGPEYVGCPGGDGYFYDAFLRIDGTLPAEAGQLSVTQRWGLSPPVLVPECPICTVTWSGTMVFGFDPNL